MNAADTYGCRPATGRRARICLLRRGRAVWLLTALLLLLAGSGLAAPASGKASPTGPDSVNSSSLAAGEEAPGMSSSLLRPPEIDDLGTLRFYQLDTLRIALDTIVTDAPSTIEELTWEVEVLDPRFLDNPDSDTDHYLVVELDTESRLLTFTTTGLFVASDIPVRLTVEDPEGFRDEEVFRIDVLPVQGVPGKVYELRQNYPNPFAGTTTIEYWIPVRARVIINVYDLSGRLAVRLVDRGGVPAGVHRIEWEPEELASGTYFYRMEALGMDGSRFVKSLGLTLLR